MITQTLQPDDTAIDHLHIHGPAEARHRVVQELSHTTPPRAKGESWVFVRKLTVRGSSANAAGRILQQIQHNLALAEQGHTDENLVQFNNLNELLAALLSDLASGRAADCWYWQRWSHLFSLAKAEALVSVMAEHLDRLNAVCYQLARQDALATVWQALDPNSAERLNSELAWRMGMVLSNKERADNTAAVDTAAGVAIAASLIDRWRPIFDGFKTNDKRRQLASLLLAQEAVPMLLLHAPHSTLALINHCFERPPSADPGQDQSCSISQSSTIESPPASKVTPPMASSSGPAGKSVPHASTDQSHIVTGSAEFIPAVAQEQQETGPGSNVSQTTTSAQTPTPRPLRPTAGQMTSKAVVKTTPPQLDQPESNSDTPVQRKRLRVTSHLTELQADNFHTAQGGVFYLLNFLNRAEVQTLINDTWQELPNGWGWLYRLAQTLAFDATDPLSAFFARQLNFESVDQLQELPPMPASQELSELAQRWYGKTGIWQPTLLELPARIACSPSHLDLYSSMQHVRLEIRLAALDINPGWLPWLGRVVQFHYTSESP